MNPKKRLYQPDFVNFPIYEIFNALIIPVSRDIYREIRVFYNTDGRLGQLLLLLGKSYGQDSKLLKMSHFLLVRTLLKISIAKLMNRMSIVDDLL